MGKWRGTMWLACLNAAGVRGKNLKTGSFSASRALIFAY
jgi:hypothetical protein